MSRPSRILPRLFVPLTVAAVIAGPLSRSEALLDKTRFAAHLGAAYFAFHHWVLSPYQQGRFSSGAPGRTASLAKGGLALLFAAHEVQVAEVIAHNSNSPLLQKVDAGLNNLTSSFTNIGQDLQAGKFNPQALSSLNGQTQLLSSEAAAAGESIKDVAVPIPGL